jgi:hypothetical protein
MARRQRTFPDAAASGAALMTISDFQTQMLPVLKTATPRTAAWSGCE